MKKSLFIFLCVAVFNMANAQSYQVTTVVGNGTGSYTGDGGQATAAELHGA